MKDHNKHYYKFLINFYILNKKLARIERKTEERKRNSERKRGGWGKKYVN